MEEQPRAYVTEVEGQLVLVDPDAVAIVQAIGRPLRIEAANANRERVAHFVQRMKDTGKDPAAWCIVVIEVDDPHGGILVDALMPGADWQQYRDRGEKPFARGIAPRRAIEEFLKVVHQDAHDRMIESPEETLVVVFAGHGGSVYRASALSDPIEG